MSVKLHNLSNPSSPQNPPKRKTLFEHLMSMLYKKKKVNHKDTTNGPILHAFEPDKNSL